MYEDLYSAFLISGDTLRIYLDEELIFSSEKDRLLPMMEFLDEYGPAEEPVTIFDKVMGNAAALLAVKIKCRAVYSPLGSELAIETLENNGIAYHLNKVVPHIMRADGKDMCPMEKLSIDKTPDEFYREMLRRIEANK
jgi:hypothetical protein